MIESVLLSETPLFFSPKESVFPNAQDPIYTVIVSDDTKQDKETLDKVANNAVFKGQARLDELNRISNLALNEEIALSSFDNITIREIFNGLSDTITALLTFRFDAFNGGDTNLSNKRLFYVGLLIIIITIILYGIFSF